MNNITVTKTKNQGFKVEHSNFNLVSNSYFGQNGRVGFLRGFFWNYNSNFTFVNVTFDGNTAKQGANFYYEWSNRPFWLTTFENVVFKNSEATQMGGSVLYFLYRPVFINVTFSKNIAPYGPNIASYPVKVILYGTTSSNFELDNIASGQLYPKQLKFSGTTNTDF